MTEVLTVLWKLRVELLLIVILLAGWFIRDELKEIHNVKAQLVTVQAQLDANAKGQTAIAKAIDQQQEKQNEVSQFMLAGHVASATGKDAPAAPVLLDAYGRLWRAAKASAAAH